MIRFIFEKLSIQKMMLFWSIFSFLLINCDKKTEIGKINNIELNTDLQRNNETKNNMTIKMFPKSIVYK
jgi:hypothetical protein